MAKENKINMPIPTLDDLFQSTKPEDIVEEKVVKLPVKSIVPFPNHPFKVNDIALEEMIESIRNNGINVPITVRKKDDGNYELISGHRRKRACELLGIKEIPCIIRDLTDDEAIIQMVDSNIQREEILPSERAFAYKMKMEALKHQGERRDLTSCPMDTKLEKTSLPLARKLKGVETAEILAKEFGENRDNIYRYIRLTNLISELLEMVDNKRIAFRPAVELSHLKEDEQYILLDFIECSEATPSLAQAIHLKKLSQEDKLSVEKMEEIMLQQKANQKDKYKITYDKFTKYIPRNVVTPKEVEEHLLKCAIACDKYGINLDDIQIDLGDKKSKKVDRER